MTHSRNKGARGEREAAAYLRKLGFDAQRNGRNGYSTDDLIVKDLPNTHIEVKFGVQGMDMHTGLLRDAFDQANGAATFTVSVVGGPPIRKPHIATPTVLWKPTRRPWRLTYMVTHGLEHVTGDECIAGKLRELNGR